MAQTTKKKKKRRSRGIIGFIISLFMLVVAIALPIQVFKLKILPMAYFILLTLIILSLAFVLFIIRTFKAKRFTRFLCTILCLVLTVVLTVGNVYIYKTGQMFEQITNLTTKTTNTITLTTMANSPIQEAAELEGKRVGIIPEIDQEGTQRALDELKDINFKTIEYEDVYTCADDLYDGSIDAMVLNDAFLGILHDEERFTLFTTQTKQIHKTIFYTDREKVLDVTADRVDVESEPFVVLICGNDSYGSLNEVSRCDVNMLVTVNPNTGTILMSSIPRDFYVEVKGNDEEIPAGSMDKLTHTGLLGIETTEASLENLLGININYTVRVNFSSLVKLVDALGGVDVKVEKGLAVDTFYSNSTLEGVKEGMNHLDGERALAFARERHAYEDGDNQRVINQQIVLSAIINKMTSPSMILHYGTFVDAIGGAFETDMPNEDIQKFLRFEISHFPNWKFESHAMYGYSSYEYCMMLGGTAFVFIPEPLSVECGSKKIKAVLDGQSSDTVNEADYIPTYEY